MAEQFPILKQIADEIIERAQLNLGVYRTVRGRDGKSRKRRAVSSGNLQKSLNYTIRSSKNNFQIKFGASGEAANYFRVVNDGRGAGKRQPPVESIVKWMKQKPIRLRNEKGFVKQTEQGIRSVAFTIAKSIGKNGIAPYPYYTDAIDHVLKTMDTTIKNELNKEIEAYLKSWQ